MTGENTPKLKLKTMLEVFLEIPQNRKTFPN